MPYAIEFPDYPAADLPQIPAHWVDRSWHNEPCPSFSIGDADGLVVFVDFLDSAVREFPESKRFTIHGLSQFGQFTDMDCVLHEGDDWAAVLAFVADHERALRLRDGTLTLDDARALLTEEEAAPRPCPDMLRYLRRVISGEALTFQGFQASASRNLKPKAGQPDVYVRTYAEGLEIERHGSAFVLTIASMIYSEPLSDLERRLFDWARGEGYFQ